MNKINLPWLIFYIFQIGIFQFYAAPRLSRFGLSLMKLRNKEVFNQVSKYNKYFHNPLIDYVIGSILIAYLIYGYVFDNDQIISRAHILSVLAFLLTCLLIDGIRSYLLKKKLPLQSIRVASLKPRSIGVIVPRSLWISLFVFSAITFWYSTDKTLVFAVNLSVSIFGLCVGFFTERRKPIINNVEDDFAYRKSEAWTIFYVFLSLPCIFLAKFLYPEVVTSAIISAVPIIFFIGFLNSTLYKKVIS
tara:strand:+ start:1381 stop:2121 length:741 start_codon:yes stop_codon:yes gene_type:complete